MFEAIEYLNIYGKNMSIVAAEYPNPIAMMAGGALLTIMEDTSGNDDGMPSSSNWTTNVVISLKATIDSVEKPIMNWQQKELKRAYVKYVFSKITPYGYLIEYSTPRKEFIKRLEKSIKTVSENSLQKIPYENKVDKNLYTDTLIQALTNIRDINVNSKENKEEYMNYIEQICTPSNNIPVPEGGPHPTPSPNY